MKKGINDPFHFISVPLRKFSTTHSNTVIYFLHSPEGFWNLSIISIQKQNHMRFVQSFVLICMELVPEALATLI